MAASTAFTFVSMAKALPPHSNNNNDRNLKCTSRCSSFFNGIRIPCHLPRNSVALYVKSSRSKPLETLMMAKRQIELEELRKLSDDEIKESVVELKGELVVLRMKQAARQEIKSSEFQRMRKRIARMLTIYRERELEKGINKRQSRKLDRAWKRSIVVKPPPSLVALMEKKEES